MQDSMRVRRIFGAAPVASVVSSLSRKGKKIVDVLITYCGEEVSVPKGVADFLEADRRAMAAQGRQDRRRLSKSSFETMPDSHYCSDRHDLEDTAIGNLCLERLRKAVAMLNEDEQRLAYFRFQLEMTLEEIGTRFGVSKMAISKRLKKLTRKLGACVE